MKKLCSIICLFFILTSAFSQNYELGKVTINELKESIHPKDSAASAAVILKKGRTYFDIDPEGYFCLISEVETKIKIYKKEGYEYANFQVPYYTGGKPVRLFFDNAVTYNLVDGKVEKTKLRSDGEFTEKVNDNFSYRKIAMPNVKEGSIVEFKYTLRTPYYTVLPDWRFQFSIPANFVEYNISIPQYYQYNQFMKGYLKVPSVSKNQGAIGKSYMETKTVYTVTDVPAIKNESYVNNIENYISTLQMELASTNFPNTIGENFATDWNSVAKTIYDDKDFGNELDNKSYFIKDIDALLKDISSREDRINAIFNYVKSRMNWNERYGYYCNSGVKKAYAEKVGNVAEINLMLTAMLRYAELKANPVLISTRSNGIALFPNRAAYNYVIAAVELENGKYLLLDATTKNSLPNILPTRVLNWTGRMIREDKSSSEVDLMPTINSKDIITVIATIDEDGKISGKARDQYFDYNAYVFRENYLTVAKDSYLEKIEKKHPGIEIGEYTTANDRDLSKPMIETFDFTHSNLVETIGNKIYFSPMLFYAQTQNPFKEEIREYPVDFSFPYQDKYSISITIPNGYEVESLPKPIMIAMEQNIGSFKFNISNTAKQIQLIVSLDMNYANIPPDFYGSLKDFYKAMIEKQTEKVVLKKV